MSNWIENIRQEQMDLAKNVALDVANELICNEEFLEPFKKELNQIQKEIGFLTENFQFNQSIDISTDKELYHKLLTNELFEDTLICLEEFTEYAVDQILNKNVHPDGPMILLNWVTPGPEYKKFLQMIENQTEMPKEIAKLVLKHLLKDGLNIPILGKIVRDAGGIYLTKDVEILSKWKKLLDIEKESYMVNLEHSEIAPSMQRPKIDID